MNHRDLLRALLIPLLEPAVLMVLVLFSVLLAIGQSGMLLGLLVLIFSLPPIFRYLVLIVEDCARGESPGALDAEFFNWVGGMYAFFPLPLVIAFGAAAFYAHDALGMPGLYVTLAAGIVILPASLALLAITHSPLQSINPVAIWRLLIRSHRTFWIAPLYLALIVWFSMQDMGVPILVTNFVQLFLMFSFAAVTGTLIEPERLIDDVDIPEPVAPLRDKAANDIEQQRIFTLSHAYGFISRDNREGGFKHIFSEIERDPNPLAAWQWYFEQMLGWEQRQHALFFAQHCIRDMLAHNENIPALKLINRCLLLNEQFKPFREDIPAAIEAAERCGNIELAAVLKRG
jgi:hypothetical protein